MKIVCEACGETTDAANVRVDDGAVLLTCARCGYDNRLDPGEGASAEGRDEDDSATAGGPSGGEMPAKPHEPDAPTEIAAAADRAERPELAPVKCPKCFHRQHQTDFCERCGLNLETADDSAESWEKIPDWLQEEIEQARKLWVEVERDPSRDEAHTAFLDYCVENRLLEFAVRRYRARLSDHPDERSTASFGETAVQKLEVYALSRIATDNWTEDLTRRIRVARTALFVIAALLVIAGLVLMVLMFRKQGALLPSDL